MGLGDLVGAETLRECSEHERLALRQLGEGCVRPQRGGALRAEQLEQLGAFGPSDDRSSGDDIGERRVDVVEVCRHLDPASGTGFEAGCQDGSSALGGQHDDLGSERHGGADQVDAAADAVAQVEVQQDALRSECSDVLHDVVRRGAAVDLNRPRALRQCQFQPGGEERVLLDDEHPMRSRPGNRDAAVVHLLSIRKISGCFGQRPHLASTTMFRPRLDKCWCRPCCKRGIARTCVHLESPDGVSRVS